MPQTNLAEYVETLDQAGLLRRYTEEKRVDELPRLMEDNPEQAVFVEKIKDCAFPFFANGYASRKMYALALGCDERNVGREIARRTHLQRKAELVKTAPCKDVVLKGDEVDLTIFPLFVHHPRDGQAYFTDTRVITRHPDTGETNDGIQRMMYRSKNSTNANIRAHVNALALHRYMEMGQDMPWAVCIGGPTLDKIASMMHGAGVDCWDRLGGFRGEPVQVVRCETNDLTVPANAEIVLEGRVIAKEGYTHDEGPFGEFTSVYGEGLVKNLRAVIDCITYRKGAIYQYATVGGLHPGRTDMYAFQPAVESDVYIALQRAGINVLDVHMPPDGDGNIIYARIKTQQGGDAMQTLALMLTSSRQWLPKIPYVFDEDMDIYDETRVKWAQGFRYNPGEDTLTLKHQNQLPLDPTLIPPRVPARSDKIGFDCTIPIVGDVDRSRFEVAVVSEPFPPSPSPRPLSEQQVTDEMTKLLQERPRTWHEISERFADQPYNLVARAFGTLRPKLGRRMDLHPEFSYAFSGGDFDPGKHPS